MILYYHPKFENAAIHVLRYLVHNIRVQNKKKKIKIIIIKRIRKAKTEDLHCHADLTTIIEVKDLSNFPLLPE